MTDFNVTSDAGSDAGFDETEHYANLVSFWVRAMLIAFSGATIACVIGARIVTGWGSSTAKTKKKKRPKDELAELQTSLNAPSSVMGTYQWEDPALEQEWQEESYETYAADGALILHVWLWGMLLYRGFRMVNSDTCMIKMRGKIHFFECTGLLIVIFLTARCRYNRISRMYWPLLLFACWYVLASEIPPLQHGCAEIRTPECLDNARSEELNTWIKEAVLYSDCSPNGVTASLTNMTWIQLLPWLLYSKRMIHLVWIWIAVYVAWSVAYHHYRENSAFSIHDVIGRTVCISAAQVVASLKKYYLEYSGIKRFLADIELRRSSERIFRVFQYMVPTHVIIDMLKNPGKSISEHIEQVSIMFVIITEFDQIAAKSTPDELLQFLNRLFSKMDRICADNQVTKIETVGEEYVACVGVVPEDIDEAKQKGHQAILGRLFQAGSEILELQEDELKFKIGVHTGPIVAGVIGNKLPRYRLFGDTINTAARMMQKGLERHLQFGEATHALLPPNIEVSYRGEVEMKGKGKVKAWQLKSMGAAITKCSRSQSASCDSFCSFRGEVPQEVFDKQLFQGVVEGLGKDIVKKKDMFRLWKFSPAMEKEWRQDYHERTFSKKMDIRLMRQCLILTAVTVLELTLLVIFILAYSRNWSLYMFRIPLYLVLRATCIGIVLYWRKLYLSGEWKQWMTSAAEHVQAQILLTTCLMLFLLCLSHNIITITCLPGAEQHSLEEMQHALEESDVYTHGPSLDQLFLLIFYLEYHVMSTFHYFRFYPSLALIPVGILCMLTTYTVRDVEQDSGGLGTLFFSLYGRILFVVKTCMCVVLTLTEEQSSRARFEARVITDKTKARTETILRTLMPPLVVEQLQMSPALSPSHEYKRVTVQQSDLCGFTQLSATRTPEEVVGFISELFGMFDDLTDKYGIYKVETVGDAYIAGKAERPLTYDDNPIDVIRFGLESVLAVKEWSRKLGGDPVGCRVGIHFGECTGGVVGTDMQRYHLFGGLMTVLEVMESCGKEGQVHVSSAAYAHIMEKYPQAVAPEKGAILKFEKRTDEELSTSKGEKHSYSEAGGPTYFCSSTMTGFSSLPATLPDTTARTEW